MSTTVPLVALVAMGPLVNPFRISSDLMTILSSLVKLVNETSIGLLCMLVCSSVSAVWFALVSTSI